MLPLSVLLNKIPKFLKPAWGTTVALLPPSSSVGNRLLFHWSLSHPPHFGTALASTFPYFHCSRPGGQFAFSYFCLV